MSPLGMSGLTTVLHKELFPVVKKEGKREEKSRITMRDMTKRAKVYQTGMGEKMSGCSTPSPRMTQCISLAARWTASAAEVEAG